MSGKGKLIREISNRHDSVGNLIQRQPQKRERAGRLKSDTDRIELSGKLDTDRVQHGAHEDNRPGQRLLVPGSVKRRSQVVDDVDAAVRKNPLLQYLLRSTTF
jgi:hypothetical protein